jgi:hypothetical protein
LEERTLLSTVTWINASGGDWDTPSNWSTDALPGPSDDVVINMPGITVTHGGASDSVNSINSQASIALTVGTLSIASASTINGDLDISGATLNVTGDLVVNGFLTLDGTILNGTTLSGPGTVDAGGGLSLLGYDKLTGTALINHAAATWQLDTIGLESGASIDNLAGASFAVTGPGGGYNGIGSDGSAVSFINAGSFTASTGADVRVQIPFANSGSVQLLQGDLELDGTGGTASTGSFTAAAGTHLDLTGQALAASSVVSSDGSVAIEGSTEAGSFRAAGGTSAADTTFTGPVVSLGPSLDVHGPVAFAPASGGPVTLATDALTLATDPLTLHGATLGGTDSFVVAGLTTLISGTLAVPALDADGGLSLVGAAELTGTELINHADATWQLTGGAFDQLWLQSGASIDNLAGASFAVTGHGLPGYNPIILDLDGSAVSFINAGSFTASTDIYVDVQVPFANSGSVQLLQGRLGLGGTGSMASIGSFTAAAGTHLDLRGQALAASSVVSSDGSVGIDRSMEAGSFRAAGGTAAEDTTFTGPVVDLGPALDTYGAVDFSPASGGPVTLAVGALTVLAYTLGGTDSFAVAGLTTLDDSTGLAVPTVDAYGGLSLVGGLNTLTGTALINHAAATWQLPAGAFNGIQLQSGASIDNLAGASFTVTGTDPASGGINSDGSAVAFINAGSFTASTGTDVHVNIPFANSGSVQLLQGGLSLYSATNTGAVVVSSGTTLGVGSYTQTAGSTALNGGTINGGALSINEGALSGSGTINATVTNGGQAIPGGAGAAGILTINGTYTQTATGALDIDIGGTTASTQYDQLAVSRAATLDGTLDVALINGFQPAFGNSFQVVTFGSSAGNFATYNAPSLASGLFLDSDFTASSLTLDIDRVAIGGAPAFPMEGIPINLTATVIGPSAGNSFNFAWTVTQNGNPFGSGAGSTFSFTPNLNATYLLRLTVTDAAGARGTTSLQLIVAPSIFVVNPSASGALAVSGNASIDVPGQIVVDSSSASALSVAGNVQITASAIDVQGGFQATAGATISPAPATGVSVADPLGTLATPNPTGLTSYGSATLTKGLLTIYPGIYSQISVSGNASLTMSAGSGGSPGIYIIEGGGLTVTGNASLTGQNVFIYNTGSNYPGSGGNFGGITLSGNGTFSLTAPASGPYAGIVIFQSRANTRALSLGGNAMSGISGIMYAPNALLSVSGSSQLQAALDVGMLNLSGNIALTQTAAGSDGIGDTSGIANTLLAGDLSVYINDPGGLFTADELARIQDAINAWDAILAPYNVTITEVSDPTLANIVIDTSTTSACGGMSNGVLGCYNEPNSEITLIQGWNWYAGSDPTQIGASQYDFETTVLHELGHALGLGGSTNPSSPMYETLAAGVADRTVTVADLNIADSPEGADPQKAAGFLFDLSPQALAAGRFAANSGSSLSVVGLMPLVPAGAGVIGQWSVVSGQWLAAGGPAGSLIGPEPAPVVQGLAEDNGRELPLTGHEAGRVRDLALADLVADADQTRGEDAEETNGIRALPGARDVEDGTGPERIRSHRFDPAEFVRPVEVPLRVRPIERGLIRIDSISDALLDELAAAAVGLAGGRPVPADPIARPETPREPREGMAHLAATLIVAGSWAHRARFRRPTIRQARTPRYRQDSE